MKAKFTIAAMLTLAAVSAGAMSVNVSGPGAVSPFTGYRMTYTDKDGHSCTFRFKEPGDGHSYLVSDQKCPSFVTKERVFMDAQNALQKMDTISHAFTFAEYFGDDGYGHKVKRAKLNYRCAHANDVHVTQPIAWAGASTDPKASYMFMPIPDPRLPGWYRLDYYPNGYKPYHLTVGAWRLQNGNTIVAVDGGRNFTIRDSKTKECFAHPVN